MPPRVLCSQVFFGAWYSISWLLNYSCGASTRCDGTTICIGEGSAPANEQQREAKHNLLHGGNHVRLWQWRLKPQIETSMVNRVLYTLSGSLGYGWFLKHFVSRPDIRETLRRHSINPPGANGCFLPGLGGATGASAMMFPAIMWIATVSGAGEIAVSSTNQFYWRDRP